MCGICGIVHANGAPVELEPVRRMRTRLAHRGPDDVGEFCEGPAGLGFQRLSILDLEGGHQPMRSPDGRFAIVFNGEIFNHPQLRIELEALGTRFRTRSDTETILELFIREGAAAFSRLSGMFAVAVWDRGERRLTLARDPIGIKPVYYSLRGDTLLFSSELRSLIAGAEGWALDPAGILDFLCSGRTHAPRTVLRDVSKLPPATTLEFDASGLRLHTYWRLPRGRARSSGLRESVDTLDRLLTDAVRGHCLSDVPVGVFLSGGVDSALVAALMARQAGARKIQTFTVGFSGADPGLDESPHARIVAESIGSEHHELVLPANVLDSLEGALDLLDEPIADYAILPTFLLARFARERVKVVLTGEGADELFAGYNRYKAAWVNEVLLGMPGWARMLAAPAARHLGNGAVFSRLPFTDARRWVEAAASSRNDGLLAVLHPEFRRAIEHTDHLEWVEGFGDMRSLNDALALDFGTLLCDSLLMKVDKSTMMASLEARVPFLDKSVVEFAATLPAGCKIRRFKGKYVLREVAKRYLPRSIVWRRKHGFNVPWEAWVRRPDNSATSELLDGSALRDARIFDPDRLRSMRTELVAGSRAADPALFFRIAVFGLWLGSLGRERHVSL